MLFCNKCGRTISNEAVFCQWCGTAVRLANSEDWRAQINLFRRQSNDIEIAKLIYKVYINELFFPKYESFEVFGERELGLKRAQLYNYKWVGERFFDKDGNFLIHGGNRWTIGKLNELRPLATKVEVINSLIARGIIYPGISSTELRNIMREYRKEAP